MHTALKLLFAPLEPFVLHPELACLPAALFTILFAASLLRSRSFKPRRHLIILFAVLGWILFALNEAQAQAAGWNIRVDLLASWPLLLAISIAATWAGFRDLTSRVPGDQNH